MRTICSAACATGGSRSGIPKSRAASSTARRRDGSLDVSYLRQRLALCRGQMAAVFASRRMPGTALILKRRQVRSSSAATGASGRPVCHGRNLSGRGARGRAGMMEMIVPPMTLLVFQRPACARPSRVTFVHSTSESEETAGDRAMTNQDGAKPNTHQAIAGLRQRHAEARHVEPRAVLRRRARHRGGRGVRRHLRDGLRPAGAAGAGGGTSSPTGPPIRASDVATHSGLRGGDGPQPRPAHQRPHTARLGACSRELMTFDDPRNASRV